VGILCIFLTLLYSVRIYKALFNTCGFPVVINRPSFVILTATYSEVFAVVVHFSWISRNVGITGGGNTLRNVYVALLVIILVALVVTFLINIRVIRHVNNVLLQAISTRHYYKWFVTIPMFKNFEVFLNYLNINIHLLGIIFTRKLYLGYYYNRLILLILFIIILL